MHKIIKLYSIKFIQNFHSIVKITLVDFNLHLKCSDQY